MILITGASGQVGRRIVEILSNQKQTLRLMTRDKNKIKDSYGSEIIQADFAEPETLDKAFQGIDSAFIVSGYAEPGERAKLHKNAIDAAVRAHVKNIVYLSFQGASPTSKFSMGRDHFQTEQHLKESGIPFTALRDNFYLDLVPEFFNEEGILQAPAGNGSAAWVTRDDVARVAAAILVNPGRSSAVYDVTGPESVTMKDTAKRISAMVGRELHYKNETLEEARIWRSKLGATDWEVDMWLGSYEAISAGELEKTSDTVFKITGKNPMNIEEFFRNNVELLNPLRTKM